MKRPDVFTEISLLTDGEIPRGAIPVRPAGSPSNLHWREVARYVVYEEVFDDETRKFNPPQYPSFPYRYFDRLCTVLQKDLLVLQSNATTSEDLMKDAVKFLESEGELTSSEDLVNLELALTAPRWHPQVNRRQSIHHIPRLSISGPPRRPSLVAKTEETMGFTNKNLSVCLRDGAEGCSIMVGCLPCLSQPLYLLIRLVTDPAPKLLGMVEVDVGIRFVLLALTPRVNEERAMYQTGRCFATMLNDSRFLTALRHSQDPGDIYRAALGFRRDIILISGNYSEILNRSGGIDVSSSDDEVEFERADLVFEDILEADLQEEMTSSNLSLEKEPQAHCSKHPCKRLCPPFYELMCGIKALASRMPSDYIDAFTKDNVGTMFSSILFIYFVVFAPSVTFGTLMCKYA
ncbi:unnamed protein product [Hydatigera taeniaeformis]|uniref:Band 3 cytoplasmic domain-containing protein n=1 Tax=Hydatigena taeniaeformis TaxID=6205 RepID=A0A3P7EE95_HYDTA|nr:unnamed protein product [Hydatigera taeniaeformis]